MFLLRKKADEEIIRHVLAGRSEAYAILVERYLPVVYGLALARTGNRADADDTTQEAFLKAYVSLDQLRDTSKFGPWLISIAKNVCGQLARVSRREAAFMSNLALDGMVTPPNLEREELKKILWDEIQELDESSRDILVLHYRAGKSSREIAALLEISDDAVRKRLQRAREALSDRLLPNLQKEKEAAQSYKDRAGRIMGIVMATSVPWKPLVAPTVAGTLASTLSSATRILATHKVASLAAAALLVVTAGLSLSSRMTESKEQATEATQLARQTYSFSSTSRVSSAFDEALGSLLKRVRPGATEASENEDREVDRAWSLVRPESGLGAIDGVVVYPDGQVAAGARVDLIRGDKWLGTPGQFHDAWEDEPPNGIWKTTHADSKGRFSFANLPLIEYSLMARTKDGFLLRTVSGLRFASQTRMDTVIFLELHEAGPVSGTVVNQDGQPISGATVYPYFHANAQGSDRPLSPSWQKGLAAFTDSSGRFTFESLEQPRWRFLVTAPGYASTLTNLVDVGEEEFPIALRRGGSASGQVVLAETGQPLADVVVRISPVNWYFDGHEAITGRDGYFSVTGLQAGEWLAELDSPHFALPLGLIRFWVGGDSTAAELRLEATTGAVLAGVVRDSHTKLPAKGVQVVAWARPEGGGPVRPYYSPPTDASGEFRIAALPQGRFAVQLYRDGQTFQPGGSVEPVVLAATDSESGKLSLLMPSAAPEAVLGGLVTDTEGRPVACAVVRGEVEGQPVAASFTDSRGRFELTGVASLPKAQLYARKGEYLASHRIDASAGDAAANLTLTLETAATVEGRLLDTAGNPLLAGTKKAIVTAVPVFPADAPVSSTLTGLRGWFKLTGLTAGVYDLYIQAQRPEDGFPSRTRLSQVQLVAGQELTGVELVYGQQDEEYTLAGHVKHADGSPAVDATVVAEGAVRREAATTSDGRFVLRGLTAGSYKLMARSNTGGMGLNIGRAGDADRGITLLGLGEVAGQVIDRTTGQPVKNFEVSVGNGPYYSADTAPDMNSMSQVYDEKGKFRIASVPVGTAVLTVRAPGYAPGTKTVEKVRPGECLSDVTVRIDRGGEIAGRATAAGKPLSGQLVWVQAGNIGLSARTDSQGNYRLSNVPIGNCFVNMNVKDAGGHERSISRPCYVQGHKPNVINLHLQSADGALAGVVTIGGKAPSRAYLHVQVSLAGGGKELLYADVNPDGTYYLDGVPVGSASVQVFAAGEEGGQRISKASVKTIGGAVIRHDFDFPEGMVVSGRVMGVRSDEVAVLVACQGEWATNWFQSPNVMDEIQPFQSGHAVCNPDGVYSVVLDKPGTYTLAALAMPRDNSQAARPRAARAVISVSPEAETQVNLTLP